jgi:putative flippase GtrA
MPPEWRRLGARLTSREVLTFLAVGGIGYVVDLVAFNLLLSTPGLAGRDPSIARVLAVVVAMVVTYTGNRFLTWRAQNVRNRAREVTLFVTFNVLGMGFSVATLFVSHDLLHFTSRLADNLSANVVGMLLGTAFRYWAYKHYVFTSTADDQPAVEPATDIISAARRPELVGTTLPGRMTNVIAS